MSEQRPIKFRGKVEGQWWHVTPDDDAWAQFWTLVDRKTVGEFIGLKDSQERDIYEGDILKLEDATAKVVFWERPPEFGLDYYHNEDEWCDDWNLSDDSGCMKIVGNVYEHSELLKGKPK